MIRIGIDLGGTKTEILALEDETNQVLVRRRVPSEQEKGYQNILGVITELFLSVKKEVGGAPTLGIGIPGSISPKTGKIRNANFQALNGNLFKKDLEDRLQQPVWVANDANCLALSEYVLGAGKGAKSLVAFILGTGMGSGLVLDGRVLNGAMGIAGEIGHSSFDLYGKTCWCGNRGCLELYLSGTALELMDAESGPARTGRELYQAYQAGETRARLSLNRYIEYFGQAMANVTAAFDPECIVLGGGVSNIDVLYTAGLENMKNKLLVRDHYPKILKNTMGDSSGVFGAAFLYKEGQHLAK